MPKIIILIIICLIVFGGGYVLGSFPYYNQKNILAVLKSERIQQEIPITIRGIITEVSEGTLKIKSNNENVSIILEENSKIVLMELGETLTGQQQEIKRSDLRMGDEVYVSVDLGSSDKIEASSVIVFPRLINETEESLPQKITADGVFQKWFESSLKPEFIPQKLELTLGVDIGGGITQENNLYGYNWDKEGKGFYTALKYNREDSNIASYILNVSWAGKTDLTKSIASSLLNNYFDLPMVDLECDKKEAGTSIISVCQDDWQDDKNNWESVWVTSNSKGYVSLIYYFTPLGSENYKVPLFQ
jgi:hypothetical protein